MRFAKLLLAAAAVLAGTTALAQSGGEPMYVITYYSDASYTEVIGGERPVSCTPGGVVYTRWGQGSIYRTEEIAGYCSGGRTSPD